MEYDNPADLTFVNLGKLKIETDVYGLYALEASEDISFGARYGNDASKHLGGFAFRENGKWELHADNLPVAVAMARYFANHRGK